MKREHTVSLNARITVTAKSTSASDLRKLLEQIVLEDAYDAIEDGLADALYRKRCPTCGLATAGRDTSRLEITIEED